MRQLTFVSAALGAVVAFAVAAQDEPRSIQSGVYTAEQAERGGHVFQKNCHACHETAEFNDGSYLEGWSGQMVVEMIYQIRQAMPQDNPGSLKLKEYVDIAAYLFRLNSIPEGETEMDGKSIKDIRIEGPFKASGDDPQPKRR